MRFSPASGGLGEAGALHRPKPFTVCSTNTLSHLSDMSERRALSLEGGAPVSLTVEGLSWGKMLSRWEAGYRR